MTNPTLERVIGCLCVCAMIVGLTVSIYNAGKVDGFSSAFDVCREAIR